MPKRRIKHKRRPVRIPFWSWLKEWRKDNLRDMSAPLGGVFTILLETEKIYAIIKQIQDYETEGCFAAEKKGR